MKYIIFRLFILLLIVSSCEKDEPIVKYNLNITVSPLEGGTVSPSSGSFDSGETFTIISSPSSGYILKGWSGDVSGTENAISVTMNSDKNITVDFEKSDSDGDGVTDDVDECPDTPNGETVNSLGCVEPEVTFVPDNVFEQTLIDLGIDDELDDYVLTNSIKPIKELVFDEKEISDFTGIEGFENLEKLDVTKPSTSLTSINLSSNLNLVTLYVNQTNINSFDLSNNTGLTFLDLSDNQLSSIDLSKHIDLTFLDLAGNQFTTIDLSNNINLTQLDIEDNLLTSLEISPDINLTTLWLSNNQFAFIDVSLFINLTEFGIDSNPLTCIKVSQNQLNEIPSDWLKDEEDSYSINCLDSDGDGITDDVDTCPNTPSGETVDGNGCSDSQKDSDGDGITDDMDICPNTPNGETVNSDGCTFDQKVGNGLLAWFPFNNNVNDESGNNNNGTIVGSVPFINDRSGISNSAIQGGGGYVPTTTFFNFKRDEAFSYSTWFTVSGSSNSGRLVSTESNEGHFRIGTNGNNLVVQFGDYLTTPDVSLNQWHHLVYVYDNRNEYVYLDGELVITNYDNITESLNYTRPFTIGAKASPSHDTWTNKIDDVGVWNRVLTEEEILYLFNN